MDTRTTQYGKAALITTAGAIDAYANVTLESVRADHAWDEEVIKDFAGFDESWIARNAHIMIACTIKLTGAGKAAAITNGAFLLPNALVTLSGFDCPWLNITGVAGIFTGGWQYYKGGSIDLRNDRVGGLDLPLRKYADPTQNTASTTLASA